MKVRMFELKAKKRRSKYTSVTLTERVELECSKSPTIAFFFFPETEWLKNVILLYGN